jgi:hypothetical protein
MVQGSFVHRLQERIHGVQFSACMPKFKPRIFTCSVLLIVISSTYFVSELSSIFWQRHIVCRTDYVKVCNLLSAFNLSNHPQSLSPALHAAAAELIDKSTGKIELLLKASLLDKQLTPHESRGRSLTKGTFWVILSCSDDPKYAFSLPMVSLAWSKIAGARPLVLLVGSGFQPGYSLQPQYSWIPLMMQTLKELDIDFQVLQSNGVTPTTFAQVTQILQNNTTNLLQTPTHLRRSLGFLV